MATKNWAKHTFDLLSLSDGGTTNKWTVSASGTSEYYYNQGDLNGMPLQVFESGVALTLGTLGSLAVSEYALGDNDTIGSGTVYVRLSDNTDPDAGAANLVECTDIYEIAQGADGNLVTIIGTAASNLSNGTTEVQSMTEDTLAENDVYVLSYNGKSLTSISMPVTPSTADLLDSLTEGNNAETYAQMPFVLSAGSSAITITWKSPGKVDNLCTAVKTTGSGTPVVSVTTTGTGDCDFIVYFTTSADVVYYQYGLTLLVTDGPFSLPSKFTLNNQDKIKVQSSLEDFTIMFSGDES